MSDPEVLKKLDQLARDFSSHVNENTNAHALLHNAIESLTEDLETHAKHEAEFHELILGNGNMGVFERLRNQEKVTSSLAKLFWITMPFVMGGAATIVAFTLKDFFQSNA